MSTARSDTSTPHGLIEDVFLEDRFINEHKLEPRLQQIYGNNVDTPWKLTWSLGRYIVRNAPFQLNQTQIATLRAL